MQCNLDEITIGTRYRRELGDIAGLAHSIEEIGLLHPVVINVERELIAGQRRLAACGLLGWETVPVRMVDLDDILRGEHDENVVRKDFVPSEAVAIARALEPREKAAARERQGARVDLQLVGKLPTSPPAKKRARDKLARAVGMSGRTLEKAAEVVTAAEADPGQYGKLVEQMDKTGKVNGAHKKLKAMRRNEQLRTAPVGPLPDAARLIRGDFAAVADTLEPGSVDVIITDPPYPREHLLLYEMLAERAGRLLRPGGSLFAMVGQSYLPEIMAMLTAHLTYHWTIAYTTPGGQSVQLWQRKVNTFWKPVLWFANGEYEGKWVGDVVKSAVNDNDKRFHRWGQSETGFADLVTRVTEPGDMILDPFCGAGTTGVVALALGRRFIGIDIDGAAIAAALARIGQSNDATEG